MFAFYGDFYNSSMLYKTILHNDKNLWFVSNDKFEIIKDYSWSISAGQQFEDPVKLKVKLNDLNLKEFIVSAQIYEFSGKIVSNSWELTEKYFDFHTCWIFITV